MKQRSNEYQIIEDDRPLQLLKLVIALLLLLAIIGLLIGAFAFLVKAPLLLYPHPGDRLTDSRLTISGTGTRGSQVEVLLDGQSRGTTPVNQDGGWSLTTDVEQLGEHWLHGQTLNRLGVVVASGAPVRFFLITPPPLPLPTVMPSTVTTTASSGTESGAIIISNQVAPAIVVQIGADGQPAPWPSPWPSPWPTPWPLPWSTPTPCIPCTPTPDPPPTPTACQVDPSANGCSSSSPVTVASGAIIISNTVSPQILVQVAAPSQPTRLPASPCNPCALDPDPRPTGCHPEPPPRGCSGDGYAGQSYRVVPGDSLSAIAVRFGFTVRALLAANPAIRNPDLLYVGQVIRLPAR